MRILLIAPETMDMHTKRLVQRLVNASHSVVLLARENPLPAPAANFRFVQYRPFHFTNGFRPYRIRQFLIKWGNALYLRFTWMQTRPDIVHTIYIGQGAYHCALARLYPLVLTALGSDINDAFEKENPAWQARVAQTLLAADHITADTNEVLERCEALAAKPLKSSLFYFGIDLKLFYPRAVVEKLSLKQKLGIPQDAKIVLSPRRLTNKMNHQIVLQAFAQYLQSACENTFLIFRRFGSFSMQIENDLQALARDLDVHQQVIWLDKMLYEEIPILYSFADLIINIPEQDGLPVTLFEASACQVPVITSDLPSYQEFLDKGDYIRVTARDVNGVANAMQKVLDGKDAKILTNLHTNYELTLQAADQEKCFAVLEQIYRDTYARV